MKALFLIGDPPWKELRRAASGVVFVKDSLITTLSSDSGNGYWPLVQYRKEI
jgi:hypothetical protein